LQVNKFDKHYKTKNNLVMRKAILFLSISVYSITLANAQTQWTEWSTLSCFQGISARMKNIGFSKVVNQYEWGCQVKNNYDRKVTFDMSWKVGNEEKIIGQFTLQPGAVTNATSYYFNSDNNNLHVTVSKVCFADASSGGCGIYGMCYAECDEGTPNIPTGCGNKTPENNKTGTSVETDAKKLAGYTCTALKLQAKADKNPADQKLKKDLEDALKKADTFTLEIEKKYTSSKDKNSFETIFYKEMEKCKD
jgi:hypothetical protein